jgi:hypothetical protein
MTEPTTMIRGAQLPGGLCLRHGGAAPVVRRYPRWSAAAGGLVKKEAMPMTPKSPKSIDLLPNLQTDYELMQRRRQIDDKLKAIRPRAQILRQPS